MSSPALASSVQSFFVYSSSSTAWRCSGVWKSSIDASPACRTAVGSGCLLST